MKIKELIKREKFLSVSIILILACLLTIVFLSNFPRVLKSDGLPDTYFIAWGLHSLEGVEPREYKVTVISKNEDGKRFLSEGSLTYAFLGSKPEDIDEEARNAIAEYYQLIGNEDVKKNGYVDYPCGWYSGTVEWSVDGVSKEAWVTLKTYEIRIYLNEEAE